MFCHVIEKAGQAGSAAWPPSEAAVQPYAHHPRPAIQAVLIKDVEGIAEVGEKLVAVAEVHGTANRISFASSVYGTNSSGRPATSAQNGRSSA